MVSVHNTFIPLSGFAIYVHTNKKTYRHNLQSNHTNQQRTYNIIDKQYGTEEILELFVKAAPGRKRQNKQKKFKTIQLSLKWAKKKNNLRN